MTATQLAHQLDVNASTCMSILSERQAHGLLVCLNPSARKSRLYWLTASGVRMQSELRVRAGLAPLAHDAPEIDWSLYGFVCFSHRAAILSVLTEPLQAATIKRRARTRQPGIRLSANNVRDAMRLLVAGGIVRRVCVRKKKHAHYELAEACRGFPRLLQQAVWRGAE